MDYFKPFPIKSLEECKQEKQLKQHKERLTDHYVFKKDEITVALIGMCHIGTKEYYQQIQEIIQQYPLWLIEGVGKEKNIFKIKSFQRQLKALLILRRFRAFNYIELSRMLNLESQWAHIRYPKEWKHSDILRYDMINRFSEESLDHLLVTSKMISYINHLHTISKYEQGNKDISRLSYYRSHIGLIRMIRYVYRNRHILTQDRKTLNKDIVEMRNNIVIHDISQHIKDWMTSLAVVYGNNHLPWFVTWLQEQWFLQESHQQFTATHETFDVLFENITPRLFKDLDTNDLWQHIDVLFSSFITRWRFQKTQQEWPFAALKEHERMCLISFYASMPREVQKEMKKLMKTSELACVRILPLMMIRDEWHKAINFLIKENGGMSIIRAIAMYWIDGDISQKAKYILQEKYTPDADRPFQNLENTLLTELKKYHIKNTHSWK